MPPYRPLADRFWERVGLPTGDGCREWTGPRRPKGYGQAPNEVRRTEDAHRIAWRLTFGPIPEGLCVLHHCDNPPCCEPSHLFLGTVADNNADMAAKGRNRVPHPGTTGEKNGAAKISDQQREDIVRRYRKGTTRQADLGREYGLTQSRISQILRAAWSPEAGL